MEWLEGRGSAGPGHWGRPEAPATSSPGTRRWDGGGSSGGDGDGGGRVCPRACSCWAGVPGAFVRSRVAPLPASPSSRGMCLCGPGWGGGAGEPAAVGEGKGVPERGCQAVAPWVTSWLVSQGTEGSCREGRVECPKRTSRGGHPVGKASLPLCVGAGRGFAGAQLLPERALCPQGAGGSVSASSRQSSVCSSTLLVSEEWWQEHVPTLGVKSGCEENLWSLHVAFAQLL